MTKYHTLTCFAVVARGAAACELFVSILARPTIFARITHTLVKRGRIFNKKVYYYTCTLVIHYLLWIRCLINLKHYHIEKSLHASIFKRKIREILKKSLSEYDTKDYIFQNVYILH